MFKALEKILEGMDKEEPEHDEHLDDMPPSVDTPGEDEEIMEEWNMLFKQV